MVQNTGGIDALLQEERSFPPPADFAAKATMSDPDIYAKAAADPEGFWAGLAEEAGLVPEVGYRPGLERRPLRQVVHRRQAQRVIQLH